MRKSSLALFTLFTFACTTVRVPVSSLGEDQGVATGAIAPPQIELWLESGEAVSAGESSEAGRAAREALDQALANREITAAALGARDPLLVVRERAVARTPSRRHDQTAAIVGMVVGIVVVVAVVAVLVVSSKSSPKAALPPKGTGGPAALAPPHATPPAVVRVPAPHAGPLNPTPPQGRVGAGFHLEPYGDWPAPGFYFNPFWDLSFGGALEPEPLVLAPREDGPSRSSWSAPDAETDAASALVASAPPPPEEDAAPEAPPVTLELPPPPDFTPDERGFFAGDDTVLELDLLDRATGRLLWSKVAQDNADPRDAGALSRMIDEALIGQPWIRRSRSRN